MTLIISIIWGVSISAIILALKRTRVPETGIRNFKPAASFPINTNELETERKEGQLLWEQTNSFFDWGGYSKTETKRNHLKKVK